MKSNFQINLQDTYFYKLHVLANELDKAFSEALLHGTDITLSQFLLLATVSDYPLINQRQLAWRLSISPAAVNRQTEIAIQDGLVQIQSSKKPSTKLLLTDIGRSKLAKSLAALDDRVFGIFNVSQKQEDLMVHIDNLLTALKKEKVMGTTIPSATKLFKGDINAAVIAVQKQTGVEINPTWWETNVGNSGSALEILVRFDKAYNRDFGDRIKKQR